MKASTNRDRGFTLVEIAIVLVIIGLLLGGILKGQELINTAKVRAIADRQNSLKIAWFSFVERYGAIPGDYVRAQVHLRRAGNGDGDGVVGAKESPLALQHLTAAGYLRCAQCTSTVGTDNPSAKNSLLNNYGGVMSIWHDGGHYANQGGATGHTNVQEVTAAAGKTSILSVHTGPGIPSNIIADVDQKIDDGVANTGDLLFNQYNPQSAIGPSRERCMLTEALVPGTWDAVVPLFWRPQSANPSIEPNCGASVVL